MTIYLHRAHQTTSRVSRNSNIDFKIRVIEIKVLPKLSRIFSKRFNMDHEDLQQREPLLTAKVPANFLYALVHVVSLGFHLHATCDTHRYGTLACRIGQSYGA